MNKSVTELEYSVLGTLIAYPKLLAYHYNKLNINLFSEQNNKYVFETIKSLFDKNELITPATIDLDLQKKYINISSHIGMLVSYVFSSAILESYIFRLIEIYAKKDFVTQFSRLLNYANNNSTDIFDIRNKAFEIFDDLFIENFIEKNKAEHSFSNLVNQVEEKFKNIKNSITGIKSSLSIINKTMGGWQNSDLIIVAGRPGMGKTAFLIQQVMDTVLQNRAVGIFSLEMSALQIASRIVTNYTQIPNSSILRKGLKDDEKQKFNYLKSDLNNLKIHIDDTPSISIQDLRVKAKMMKIKHNIEILFVDYLQLITYEQAKNREQEISKISNGLKALAKELNIPVIALSQLSRQVENRNDKRPLLSDLRDSGSIEQDADAVIFLYRPEYYGIKEWDEYPNEKTDNEAEIIFAKNRNGGILSERCKVNMPTSTFNNHY